VPRAARPGDWLTLFALAGMWGSAFLLNAIALESLPPSILVAGRILLGALVLLIVLWAQDVKLPRTFKGWLPLVFMGFFANVLPFQLVAWAQQHIDSSLAGILMAAMPLFVLTLAHFHLPGERLTTARIVGFGVGFIGVVFVLSPKFETGVMGNMALWGALATLAAAFSYSCSTVYARRIGGGHPLQMSAGLLLVASVMSVPGAMFAVPEIQSPGLAALVAVLFLGILSTGLSTLLYFRIIQGPGPAFLSMVNYLVPAWAVFAGAVFLNEQLAPATFIGLGLILAGIALSEVGHRYAGQIRIRFTNGFRSVTRWAREQP